MTLRFLKLAAVAALALSACSKSPDCKGGATVCGGSCVRLASDNASCGACGNACEAGKVCSNGACEVTCATGLVTCGGRCVDPLSDAAFCGASGTCIGAQAGMACADGQVCSAGTCQLSCQAGLLDCSGVCLDPLTDRSHCGATAACAGAEAGIACDRGQLCAAGSCVPS